MKRDYVLILKARDLTRKQAASLSMRATVAAKTIAPGRRNILAIEKKGGEKNAD